jgi:hypothetical protein
MSQSKAESFTGGHGMSFSSFAEAIKRLRDSDHVAKVGAPGNETAQLTKLGTEVASPAEPTCRSF